MHNKAGASVFVKIDEYKDIVDIMALMKRKISEAHRTIERVNVLKNEEDSELENWKQSLDEIERKIDFIDKALFEPEEY